MESAQFVPSSYIGFIYECLIGGNMVETGKLRYWALGFYSGLVALFVALDKIPLDQNTAIAVLAPVAAVLAADIVKHKDG